ncbi:late competence development protein [Leptolyngbya sp. Heron Island J]|uniref:late competence development ComFB family protein n=1 Tax=Leptolyngbya sp. Heron Island J TaxID=1385935 RepID=UPI0003B94A75|nr:late competence development ComFB family protein [Leptolyngbya sp. Heron Island J]ESA38222.1 late competence development protein [Leptolyngbya sp. Heron Island J]
MVDVKAPPPREYINVMELLVAEEVEQQLRQLPTRVLKYVKPIEVETYALNRLPSLYAVSEKGWQSQYHKAKHELRKDIGNAVRRAIAAVQVDPLRASRPLVRRPASHAGGANMALLEQFRIALGQPNLTWESLLRKCQRAGAARRGATTDSHPVANEPSYAAAYAADEYATASYGAEHDSHHDHHSTVWRPGTYGETSWHPKRNYDYQAPKPPSSSSTYDWNDSRYR